MTLLETFTAQHSYRTFFREYHFVLFALCTFFVSWYLFGFLLTMLIVLICVCVNLYTLGDKVLYYPEQPPDSRKCVDSPEKFKMRDYESHIVYAEDGIALHCYFLRKPNLEDRSKVPTIVYLHGNAGNIGHRLDNALEMYRFLNVNILLLDYRGYGKSTGKPTESGLYLDAIAAIQFLHARPDVDSSRIILFGRSLGGAVAIGTCHQTLITPKWKTLTPMALIVENSFTSVPDVARWVCAQQESRLLRCLRFIPTILFKSRFQSLEKVTLLDLPILFVCGLKDEVLPPVMMDQLFNATNSSSKRIRHFVNGSHNHTWQCRDYYESLKTFLVSLMNGELGVTLPPPITHQHHAEQLSASSVVVNISHYERSPLLANEEIHSTWSSSTNDPPVTQIL